MGADDDIEMAHMREAHKGPAIYGPAPEYDDEDDGDDTDGHALLPDGHQPRHRIERLGASDTTVQKQWPLVKGIVLESAPTLLLTTVSLLFTGKLLDKVAHWRAMREVDQLIMIIPTILNLNGNLEMNLSARLATAANVGELDDPSIRRSMIIGSLALLQLQTILVSFIASCIALLLGRFVPRSTIPNPSDPLENVARDLLIYSLDPRQQQHQVDPERKSGIPTLIMVASTATSAASLSGLLLGSFMCLLVVLCRKYNRDPDNIAPAVASCLGDLFTLVLLGFVSNLLIPFIRTPIPLIFLLLVLSIAVASGIYVLRNETTRDLIKEGWSPLFVAMAISSGTGIVLEMFVSRYEGFAILAIVISGLPGAAGSILVSRLSTALHTAALGVLPSYIPLNPTDQQGPPTATALATPPAPTSSGDHFEPPRTSIHLHHHHTRSISIGNHVSTPASPPPTAHLSPKLTILTLLLITLPIEIIFLAILNGLGWLRLPFLFVIFAIISFCCAVLISLSVARILTDFLWSINRDPDLYALPVHSALMDLTGQLLLVLCFEIVSGLGANVSAKG